MASKVESENSPNVVWGSVEHTAHAELHILQSSVAADRSTVSTPPMLQLLPLQSKSPLNKALSLLTLELPEGNFLLWLVEHLVNEKG